MQIALLVVATYLLFDIRYKLSNSKKTAKSSETPIVMDTSALIDGRVVEVIQAGFMSGNIIIAKRVLDELQLLADGRNSHKRERARYGLDIIRELQKIEDVRVAIDDFMANINEISTDEAVLKLAKMRKAMLCTTDFNLNKVASVEGVKVLNVNALARVLRPEVLPGETIELKIVQKGENKGQGVGYLEDGTMAVVDNAARMKGKKIKATVDRMIQAEAGKMIFASYSNRPAQK